MFRRLFALLVLMLAPGVAHAQQWLEVSSPHFVVYSRQKPETVKKFAADLERYDQGVRIFRNLPNDPVPPAARVSVYVLDTQDQVSDLIGNSSVAGFYIGRVSGSLAFVPRQAGTESWDLSAQQILFHEYAHHLMLSSYANSAFPAWLVEGWAEFHATATIERDGSLMFGRVANYRAAGLFDDSYSLPLGRVLAGDTTGLNDMQTNVLYARGWALVHFFTFDQKRAAEFTTYIGDINAGKSAAEASKAFGDIKQLDRDLTRYITQPRFTGRGIRAESLNVGQITVRALTPGEAATMRVRIRSNVGVSEKTAPGVYAAAKKAAAPYPNDVGAQLVLAEAAYDANDYAETLAACERALAVDPKSIGAILYKSMARMAIAIRDKDMTPATWKGIRALLLSANRIDADQPQTLYLYYLTYVSSDAPPTEAAKDGLFRAFQLVPQDPSLRFVVAQMFLDDGKPRAARTVIAPLAFDPHGGEMAAEAAKMVAQIDAGQAVESSKERAKAAKP